MAFLGRWGEVKVLLKFKMLFLLIPVNYDNKESLVFLYRVAMFPVIFICRPIRGSARVET